MLYKLWQLQRDEQYAKQALENYTQAIKLDSENPLYLIDRDRLYHKTGEYYLAWLDMECVMKLPISKEDMETIINIIIEPEIQLPFFLIKEISMFSNSVSNNCVSPDEISTTNCVSPDKIYFLNQKNSFIDGRILLSQDLLQPINLYGSNSSLDRGSASTAVNNDDAGLELAGLTSVTGIYGT